MDLKPFTDRVKITVKAGDGGDGMNSFKAYKGKPACGPDGGDGGDGGCVFLLADENVHDLLAYRFQHKYFAQNGERGGSNLKNGKCGDDIILKVPCGTLVIDLASNQIVCDAFYHGQKIMLLSGGKGGKGNARFTTARRHAPDFSQKGVLTKPHDLVLELKIVADVGLVGFPNVGKSTLLSKISAAKPKIADYHFTTLSPNLGVVRFYDDSFVAADIPGLIEGASKGAGLGLDFLRHIERTRMIVHVVDISGCENRDPLDDFRKINAELHAYSTKLSELPQFIACNKCDLPGAKENLEKFHAELGGRYRIFPITAVNGEGTSELVSACAELLKTLPSSEPIRGDETLLFDSEGDLDFAIERDAQGRFILTGSLIEMLCRNVVLNHPESMNYFQRVLKQRGVFSALTKLGCKNGDTVAVKETEFEFVE